MVNNVNFMDCLKEGASSLGIELTVAQLELMSRHYRLLLEFNRYTKLTTIFRPGEAAIKHFVDSLSCFKLLELKSAVNIIDVGTGAGFPGLPVKIFYPEINLTLLDAQKKRVYILEQIVEKLGLENVRTFHGRAEKLGAGKMREYFDLCMSRAVAPLPILTELCLPLVKVGGKFLAWKGPGAEDEIDASRAAVSELGGYVVQVYKFELPVLAEKRSLVVMDKVDATPDKYPRRPGIPSKRPLK